MTSPNRDNEDYLSSVTAITSNDVWAVGFSHDVNAGWYTLTEHWDGQEWSVVPSPNPPANTIDDHLVGVSAVSTGNVWAVGFYGSNSGPWQTLALHWDGSQWSIVPSPNVGMSNNELYGVSATSSNDVWAVGSAGINPQLTLVEHWDGSQWSVVPSPNPPGSNNNYLFGVQGISPDDAWLVGSYQGQAGISGTLAEHWYGTQWSIVPSPDFDQGANALYGVAAISTDDIWAVGRYAGSYGATIVEHWDGTQWSLVPSPNPSNNDDFLQAVAAVSSTEVWAVGWWDTCLGCRSLTLTEHYTAQCPSPSPSPTAILSPAPSATSALTSTPSVIASTTTGTTTPSPIGTYVSTATITSTPVASATSAATATMATSTATATTCPIQFTDVPEGSTFYPFIRCMACRGIISGYSSGCGTGNACFRPNNNVTRGQLSKIVSLAAGFSEEHTTQTFTDVPIRSTFYQFVERMASRGIIGGIHAAGRESHVTTSIAHTSAPTPTRQEGR